MRRTADAMLPVRDEALRGLLRFVAAALAAGALALALEGRVVASTLPLLQSWIDAIDGSFRTADLSLISDKGEAVIRRLATPAQVLVLGGKVFAVDARTEIATSALAGLMLQPLVVGCALLLAWPWRRGGELLLRYAFGLPLLLLVVLFDVPLMLCGYAWSALVDAYEPGRFSPLIDWADFMNAGGRFALAVAAVAVATALAQRCLGGGKPVAPLPAGGASGS